MPPVSSESHTPLPALRQDLEIMPAGPSWSGAPTFLIVDKVTNRYFRIGKPLLEVLSAWRGLSATALRKRMTIRLKRPVDASEIEAAAQFIIGNGLNEARPGEDWRRLHNMWASRQESLWKKAVHRYIFFRIPLVRPQRFLNAAWPLVRPLFTRSFALICAITALFALFMVSRQWDAYRSTFMDFLSLEGLVVYAASLIFIKALHELGHAFMATRYGVEVPVIGAAFIVLMPILYTDTTGAHRLRSRRERLNIDLAGIYVELALASFSTLLWVFLPDGPIRSIAFATATLSWILSLAVNLNPFMRFDGYYILSDLTGIENLQARGFELGKWRLRELLFRLNDPAPEPLPTRYRRWIILHAWGTWIYRFFLFLGIALLVYAFLIKIVGIFLFVVEILWFILMPIWREIKVWWEKRRLILGSRRSLISLGTGLALLALFLVPLSTTVEVPAVMRHAGSLSLHTLRPAQLHEFDQPNGSFVKAGDRIALLSSPELQESMAGVEAELSLTQARLARAVADREDRSMRLILEEERAALVSKLDGYRAQQAMLDIRAPFDGIIADVDPGLHQGMWLAPENRIALLLPATRGARLSHTSLELRGMIPEAALTRVEITANGEFIPDDYSLPKLKVTVDTVQRIAATGFDEALLMQEHGGHVPSIPDPQSNAQRPQGAWYPVRMRASTADEASEIDRRFLDRTIRGVARIEAEPQSLANRVFKRVASVLIRELSL